MALLLHPNRVASALGLITKSNDGTASDLLLESLRLITPRVEEALNVGTLVRGTFTDTFNLSSREMERRRSGGLRLANGFLTSATVVVTGYAGDATNIEVDRWQGIVTLLDYSLLQGGKVSVTYESGFAIPPDGGASDGVAAEPQYRELVGLPEWMGGIVVDFFTQYRRTQQGNAPKEYGLLPTLNESMLRDLRSRIYGRYMRPRDGLVFATTHVPVA